MAKGIMIMGAAGAGKTTLGKYLAEKIGVAFVDIDDYIWRKDTKLPFSTMYSREEKIERLMNAISGTEYFVMAGSMDSFHEYFDPYFEIVVHLQTDSIVRVERVRKREWDIFGERISKGGDMYEIHQRFLKETAGYDYGDGGTSLQLHQKWLKTLGCKVIELDGNVDLEENAEVIIREYQNIRKHNDRA